MTLPQQAFYDDLGETLAESFRLLSRGVADRRSAFHHPAFVTLGLDGLPRSRTVILRGFDIPQRQLRFHTDVRSQKVREIAREPRMSMHFYDPAAKIQLRISGHATSHSDDAIADEAWLGSRLFSRQCYGISPGPGSSLTEPDGFTLPETTEEATSPGRVNFCAILVIVREIEWLFLASTGHRRARFIWGEGALSANWMAP